MPTHRARSLVAANIAVLLLVLVTASPALGTTVGAQWQAKVGASGGNGAATIRIFSTGGGSLSVSLKGVARRSVFTETVSRGTCAKPGTPVLTLPTITSSSAGTAARTNSLTAAQARLLNKAGEIIRFVAGGHAYCGAFAKVPVPAAVAATITLDYLPLGVVATPEAIWVTNSIPDSISKVDPSSNAVLTKVTLGQPGSGVPLAIAIGDGALWVSVGAYDASAHALPGHVLRVDPASGVVTATIAVGRNAINIATSPGAVWVANYDDGTVSRIDTASNVVTATIALGVGLAGLAYGEGSVWVSNEQTGNVTRIDPATNGVTATITTAGAPEGLAVAAGAAWVVNYGYKDQADGQILRIDPATNQVIGSVAIGANPLFVAIAGGYAWVSMSGESTVVQVSIGTGVVKSRIAVGGPSWGIAATDHAVWAVQSNQAGAKANPAQPGTVTRISY